MNEDMQKQVWVQLVFNQASQQMNAIEATEYANTVLDAFNTKFPADVAKATNVTQLQAVPTAPVGA